MTFLAIISLQSQNLANFAQLIKLRATYLYQTSSVAIGFPLSSPPIALGKFSMYEMFFISCSPICIWGDIGAKSEKFAIKCTSQETTANFANQRKQNRVTSNKHPSQVLHIVRSQMRILPTKKVPQIFVFWDASPKGCFSRTYARASNSDFTFLLSQVSQRAKNESSIRPPIRYYFSKNNVSFSTKQRVVFNKTTCRFQQNNVLFVKVQRLSLSSLYELQNLFSAALWLPNTPQKQTNVYKHL